VVSLEELKVKKDISIESTESEEELLIAFYNTNRWIRGPKQFLEEIFGVENENIHMEFTNESDWNGILMIFSEPPFVNCPRPLSDTIKTFSRIVKTKKLTEVNFNECIVIDGYYFGSTKDYLNGHTITKEEMNEAGLWLRLVLQILLNSGKLRAVLFLGNSYLLVPLMEEFDFEKNKWFNPSYGSIAHNKSRYCSWKPNKFYKRNIEDKSHLVGIFPHPGNNKFLEYITMLNSIPSLDVNEIADEVNFNDFWKH